MNRRNIEGFLICLATLSLAACGGDDSTDVVTAPSPSPTPAGPTSTSVSAAATTAQTAALCTAIAPFYWEVGDVNGITVDASGVSASGSVNSSSSDVSYTSSSQMSIASASKWMYASYVIQQRNGTPTSTDIPYLNFTSGHTNMLPGGCDSSLVPSGTNQTVDECLSEPGISSTVGDGTQGAIDPTNVGIFYYNSGHLTTHASSQMDLGKDDTAALTAAIEPVLEQGTTFNIFGYTQDDLAGGVGTSPADYAIFLRNILSGKLLMKGALGTNAVCTNPSTCTTAGYSPIDGTATDVVSNESWSYSMGHWVEDDPTVGDGSFSSPGAYGFYPWIDSTKTYYGIVARETHATPTTGSPYYDSVQCGRLIRKAYMTGTPQTS